MRGRWGHSRFRARQRAGSGHAAGCGRQCATAGTPPSRDGRTASRSLRDLASGKSGGHGCRWRHGGPAPSGGAARPSRPGPAGGRRGCCHGRRGARSRHPAAGPAPCVSSGLGELVGDVAQQRRRVGGAQSGGQGPDQTAPGPNPSISRPSRASAAASASSRAASAGGRSTTAGSSSGWARTAALHTAARNASWVRRSCAACWSTSTSDAVRGDGDDIGVEHLRDGRARAGGPAWARRCVDGTAGGRRGGERQLRLGEADGRDARAAAERERRPIAGVAPRCDRR